jgi:chemotaxis protein methyltransferase CheR
VIAPIDYAFLAALLRQHSGLALGEGKEYLLESRLTPVAACFGLQGIAALAARLRSRPDAVVVRAVCEAMTTNESSFFRDGTPFQLLQEQVIPALIAARRTTRRLRIWCAAASTGQEPYTVAMILASMDAALAGWTVEILGTDYSGAALERARAGAFSAFEAQRGLSPALLNRFFVPRGGDWQLRDEIRNAVRFREANLLESFAALGTFDLVLCRNVLIYFDVATKRDVLHRLADVTAPDGFLFLGAAETAIGLSDRWARSDRADPVPAEVELHALLRRGQYHAPPERLMACLLPRLKGGSPVHASIHLVAPPRRARR